MCVCVCSGMSFSILSLTFLYTFLPRQVLRRVSQSFPKPLVGDPQGTALTEDPESSGGPSKTSNATVASSTF